MRKRSHILLSLANTIGLVFAVLALGSDNDEALLFFPAFILSVGSALILVWFDRTPEP